MDRSDERTDLEAPLLEDSSSTSTIDSDSDAGESPSLVEASIDPWKNHNVILSLLLCVVAGVADSIWSSVVLSGFLLALAKSMGKTATGNTLVGSAEAVQGLTQLFTALPVGILADKWGKSKTVRLGGVLMLVTIAVTMFALVDVHLHADENAVAANRSYIVLVVALGMWGVVNGISFGPSQALYSDSVPNGKRSEMLTWLYSCYLMSSSVGPIVSIALILTVSSSKEDWSLQEIYPVFLVGIVLEVPCAIIMFFFNDKYTVPDSDEPVETQAAEETVANESMEIPSEDALDDNVVADQSVDGNSSTAAEQSVSGEDTERSDMVFRTVSGQAAIPYVLFFSSLIVSLGSGASVKYFPLFFKELGFGSAAVQGIFLAVPIFISGLSFVAQKVGKCLGRIETTVAFSSIGVSLLYLMTWLSREVDTEPGTPTQTMWEAKPFQALLIVIVYLVRTGIMNCSYPLLESILMDNVPSNQRARWKSLESIASFGWTGSALLGGILSDKHSYQYTFAFTASLQLCGNLLLIPIRSFVKSEG